MCHSRNVETAASGSASSKNAAMAPEPLVHLGFGVIERAKTGVRQVEVDPSPIVRVRRPGDEATRDETVDDGGDARGTDRQVVCERRGGGRAFPQKPEDAVLGKGQVDRFEAVLELTGESRDSETGTTDRHRRPFSTLIIRYPHG